MWKDKVEAIGEPSLDNALTSHNSTISERGQSKVQVIGCMDRPRQIEAIN